MALARRPPARIVRSAQVAFARLRLREDPRDSTDLFSVPDSDAFLQSLRVGARETRYGRTWRMAQWHQADPQYVLGRIGFEVAGATETWSEARRDFQVTEMTQGHTSPFAVDLRTLRVAFQLRPGQIKVRTFTENFRALLEAAGPYLWEVRPESDRPSWEDWLASVARVNEVRVTIHTPNPHYEFDEAERLLEGAHARSMRIIATAGPDEVGGINIDAAWLAGVLGHAGSYGSYSAKGETPQGQATSWNQRDEGRPRRVTSGVDPQTTEVQAERLAQELESEPPQMAVAPPSEPRRPRLGGGDG
jgi:hypothetical protein